MTDLQPIPEIRQTRKCMAHSTHTSTHMAPWNLLAMAVCTLELAHCIVFATQRQHIPCLSSADLVLDVVLNL